MSPQPPPLDPTQQRRLRAQAPRTWQRMLSGRRLNLIEPSPLDIEIEDIALGLSRNTRWNGQTLGDHGWSVAQHSLLVTEIVRDLHDRVDPRLLLTALLHDASEYVTHDLITPLKAAVGDVFRELEDRLMCAVYTRFGLPARPSPEVHALIKKADRLAAATEAVQLAGFTEAEVRTVLEIREPPLPSVSLTPLPVADARRLFLERFHTLEKAVRLAARS
ncbi:YfbR-like 5'-deoxynucleotidase [Pararhodospirillum photometricum]|uniref:Metal dependent phosphohydrolase, HD region n=1 Tax=Pararhodospirillum photometricum DSM 122 TaxID=1150469 RepID=H6SLD1_PARPM|nr:HD family hydrolase [Pararhodospirillum photometricum]CCG08796.1 Metal dependent phosphohydrolase, HD region [Pararhodospirillum photometricum DSM 122]